MAERSPLELLDEKQKEIVERVANGDIDPQEAVSFFRRAVKELWNTGDDFNIMFWDFIHSRFNTYILLYEIKMLGVISGTRKPVPVSYYNTFYIENDDEEKYFWNVTIRSRKQRSIEKQYAYKKWEHAKGVYKNYLSIKDMKKDLSELTKIFTEHDWISITKYSGDPENFLWTKTGDSYEITNGGKIVNKDAIEKEVYEIFEKIPKRKKKK